MTTQFPTLPGFNRAFILAVLALAARKRTYPQFADWLALCRVEGRPVPEKCAEYLRAIGYQTPALAGQTWDASPAPKHADYRTPGLYHQATALQIIRLVAGVDTYDNFYDWYTGARIRGRDPELVPGEPILAIARRAVKMRVPPSTALSTPSTPSSVSSVSSVAEGR